MNVIIERKDRTQQLYRGVVITYEQGTFLSLTLESGEGRNVPIRDIREVRENVPDAEITGKWA